MKKILLSFCLAFLVFSFFDITDVSAQIMRNTMDVFSNNKQADLYKTDNSGLQDYTPEIIYGENKFRGVFFTVQDFLYKALIPISIMLTVWAGMQLIFSRGDEETTKKKTQFLGIFFGFAVLLLSKVLVDEVFFGIRQKTSFWQHIGDYFGLGGNEENRQIIDAGQILNDSDSSSFAQEGFRQMEGLFEYAISFAAVIAVVFVIITAYKMITADNDDNMSKARKKILYTIFGMILLISSRRIVGLLRDESASKIGLDGLWNKGNLTVPKVSATTAFIMDWINYALSFIGIIAIIGIIYGGIRLISSFGQDDSAQENAKKILLGSVAGLVLVISAWTIIYYFIYI